MPRTLEIKPLPGVRKYHSKQSDLGDHLPQVPFRAVLLGPGSSGKTLAMQAMIDNHFRGVFKEIYFGAPPAAWTAVGQ